jgi:hypothetical protein
MALYTEKSFNDLADVFDRAERIRQNQLRQQQEKAMQAYNAEKARTDNKYDGGLGGFLGNIVGGIGKFVGDIGQGVGGMIGTGIASAKDLIEGKAATGENAKAFKRDWYKADSDADAAAKAAGTSLNAAANLASFIPGVGAGTAAGKAASSVAANTALGALGGFGDEFQQQGADASLESAANRALASGAAGLATGGLNRKLGNATSKVGSALLNNKLATSAIGRGALSGAVGGAVGSGTSAALGGGDVAQAALQGGLTGAAGGATQAGIMAGANRLGQKALGRLNKNTLSTTAQDVTDDEFRAYGDSALAKKTKRNQVSDSLSRFGDTLEGAQTNVTRAAARDLGIDSTGKVIENVRKKTGLTNLETQAALAKELTGGADSLMDRVQKQALSATDDGKPFKVDTSDIVRDVDKIIESNSNANDFGTETNKRKWAQNIKNDISSGATDVLTKANKMKASAAELRGKGIVAPSEGDSAKAKIYTEIANRLDERSYSAIPKENINDMFDVTINEMKSRANQASATGNKQIAKAYNTLADKLSQEPRTIQAYRSFKKDFVDVSKIDQLTARAENGAAQNLGQSASGVVKKLGNTVLSRPINSALATAGGIVNQVADAIPSITTTSTATQPLSQNTQTMLGNIIGRTTGQQQASNAVQNARKAQDYQNLENMLSNIQSASQGISGGQTVNMLGGYGTNTPAQGNSLVSQLTDIANGMSLAMAAGDISAYSQLADLYKTAYNIYQMQNELTGADSTSSSNQKLSKTQQQANAASISLDQLENMTPDFGYAVSSIPVLGNIVNAQGNQYESTAKSLAMQIGYMLSGANIKESEAEAIGRAYVPQPFDSDETRRYKLNQARKIIQQYQNGYVTDDQTA